MCACTAGCLVSVDYGTLVEISCAARVRTGRQVRDNHTMADLRDIP